MNKIIVKGVPFNLSGEAIKTGATLDFKARDIHNKDKSISEIKGHKIISIFPDINTRVCDAQTHELSVLAMKHPKVHFVSVTNDPVNVIKEWCSANSINNLMILSDREHGDFARKTNLMIPKLNKLTRGFILLDGKNHVEDIVLNTELSEMPDFGRVNTWINRLT